MSGESYPAAFRATSQSLLLLASVQFTIIIDFTIMSPLGANIIKA
jgi:hypothetical protein